MVILALLAVIGGPIIINECYKGDSGYITIWSAADTLSYYGTVLGALVAAATIAWSRRWRSGCSSPIPPKTAACRSWKSER